MRNLSHFPQSYCMTAIMRAVWLEARARGVARLPWRQTHLQHQAQEGGHQCREAGKPQGFCTQDPSNSWALELASDEKHRSCEHMRTFMLACMGQWSRFANWRAPGCQVGTGPPAGVPACELCLPAVSLGNCSDAWVLCR